MQPADQVAAFLVGVFGHRTAVDYADIGFGRRGHALEAPFGKLPGERGTLREVELAAQRMKTDASSQHLYNSFFLPAKLQKSVRKSNKNRKFAFVYRQLWIFSTISPATPICTTRSRPAFFRASPAGSWAPTSSVAARSFWRAASPMRRSAGWASPSIWD